jgi:hypothetical protein
MEKLQMRDMGWKFGYRIWDGKNSDPGFRNGKNSDP